MGLGRRVSQMIDNLGDFASSALKYSGSIVGTGINKSVKVGANVANKVTQKLESNSAKFSVNAIQNKAKDVGKSFTRNVLTDDSAYKEIKLPFNRIFSVSGKGQVLDEIHAQTRAIGNGAYRAGKLMFKKDPEHSLIGLKTTKFGTAALFTYAGLSGVKPAGKDFVQDRQGDTSDTSVRGHEPVNNYLPEGEGYGNYAPAYSRNAGASGDLVFALNSLRRGGMM